MDFEIVEMEAFTGAKAHVYSVIPEGEETSLLEQFFEENKLYTKDLKKVINKIKVMANDTGIRKDFLKEGEGSLGDGVFALDYTGQLRLYGIYFHEAVVLFGSGGYKPPSAKSYQDHPPLHAKAEQIKAIAKDIYRMIINRELKVNDDGTLE
jgi:hypothetical protein